MSNIWALISARLLFGALVVALVGCGGDTCEQGYDKLQECVKSMNCTTMDPSRQAACKAKKQLYAAPYSAYLGACRLPDLSPCSCEGAWEAEWQRKLDCTLSPDALCECR